MKMIPTKTKYKKYQKGPQPNTILNRLQKATYGKIAFKASEFGIVTNKQIEATRRAIMKKLKKQGKLWVRTFAHLPKTKKPIEVRMGKGKGSTDSWIAKIKPGTILYELDGISEKLAREIFYYSTIKFPIQCSFFYDKN